jgi:hypothetical protein
MKPERRFYFVRSIRQIPAPVQLAKTINDVSGRMVGSGRLAVCGGELLEYIQSVPLSAEPRPQP